MGGLIAVGAWHGLEYIGSTERLLLFEPLPKAFAELVKNAGGNPNATLVNSAVGSTVGRATMHTTVPSHSSSLLTPCGPVVADHPVHFDGTTGVDVVTLDGYLSKNQLEGYETLLIDTQGFELEVLRGATRTLQALSRVLLELHNPSTYAGAAQLPDLDDYMATQGWKRTALDVSGSDGLGDVTYEPTGRTAC